MSVHLAIQNTSETLRISPVLQLDRFISRGSVMIDPYVLSFGDPRACSDTPVVDLARIVGTSTLNGNLVDKKHIELREAEDRHKSDRQAGQDYMPHFCSVNVRLGCDVTSVVRFDRMECTTFTSNRDGARYRWTRSSKTRPDVVQT